MRILTSLTYYHPHYSGLTIYADRLARALVQRGHQVTILTSQYDRSLPSREQRQGVQIIRSKVWMNVSKGVLMPSMFFLAWANIKKADLVHLHLPQLDAAYITWICRMLNKPVVLTYHCDLLLPSGVIHSIANQVSQLANRVSMRSANQVVVNTLDYAEHSAFLRPYLQKIRAIPPPVELAIPTQSDEQAFKCKAGLEPEQRTIGMVARLATEKGVEFLVDAMPAILNNYPAARVLYVGQYQNVMGEQDYINRLQPQIEALGDRWTFLGIISPAELTAFYRQCDLTVLPSTNSTESFGMVQLESMSCGTPVVASNLPGVRQPVKMTGMGRVVSPADAQALADGICDVLAHPEQFQGDVDGVIKRYSPQRIAEQYEAVFQSVLKSKGIIHR